MHITIKILLITFFFTSLHSKGLGTTHNEESLKKTIGKMLVVGFPNEVIDDNTQIVKLIKKYDLGGVILFDRFYNDREKIKNIRSSQQVKDLTTKLQSTSTTPLIISIDQEGGRVARLKEFYGFGKTPSAKEISTLSLKSTKVHYDKLANILKEHGINCNFAPVVDLSIEPENFVINQLERSYGKDGKVVASYAEVFIDALEEKGIFSVLKHFPGHGSSKADSHKGFVDITDTWSQKELEPYRVLIDMKKVPMIMTAHVFNAHLDPKHPATLSYKVNTQLLRESLGYEGIIISDDMQMNAITKHYTLGKSVSLAINSGVDLLLFGNQLKNQNIDELVETIYQGVKTKEISMEMIKKASHRIDELRKKLKQKEEK